MHGQITDFPVDLISTSRETRWARAWSISSRRGVPVGSDVTERRFWTTRVVYQSFGELCYMVDRRFDETEYEMSRNTSTIRSSSSCLCLCLWIDDATNSI